MARAATTSDVFNAIAEQREREIVDRLAEGAERDVTEVVLKLGLPQPAVSMHLGVLRKVGLVTVHKVEQRRFYRLNPHELKPVHDWIQTRRSRTCSTVSPNSPVAPAEIHPRRHRSDRTRTPARCEQ
jgi:DNA-binding transcriptional ArsR family regulator